MSGTTPTPRSPSPFEEETTTHSDDPETTVQQPQASPSPRQRQKLTRTVAIIKAHALGHRFAIEERISQRAFEIIKERPMEFDVETDPDFMDELFGEDTSSLAEGAVWVYVLERYNAVEAWQTLMGDADPERARELDPTSLRALYGNSYQQNAVGGSADGDTAELQIASLFASSPVFPATDGASDGAYGSMRSISSSVLSALRDGGANGGESEAGGYAASSGTAASTANGSGKGQSGFRARDIPATHLEPDIKPKTTKAARLRESLSTGVAVDNAPTRRIATKESLAKTFKNVPGHKRSETIAVASTAPPVVAPRMTRAASLRLGHAVAPLPDRRRSVSNNSTENRGFDGVPGHKRRESISVASSKPPSIAPRLNKSAALRSSKEAPPPSSWMLRTASTPKLAGGLTRSTSQASLNGAPAVSAPAPARSTSRASISSALRPAPAARPPSVTREPSALRASTVRPPPASRAPSSFKGAPASTTSMRSGASTPNGEEAKARPRPSSAASNAPSIAPRTNRSALLRAAKMLEQSKAAVKSSATKTRALMT